MTNTEILSNLDQAYALVKAARKAPREGSESHHEEVNDRLEGALTEISRAIRAAGAAQAEEHREARR